MKGLRQTNLEKSDPYEKFRSLVPSGTLCYDFFFTNMLKVKVLTVVMFLLESVLDPQKLVCLLRWQIKTIRIGLVRDLRNKHNVIGFNHCYKKKSVANRSVVGALQYATITRPGISFSINKVCQIMKEPLEHHWVAVKRILRYLKGTLSCGLHLKPASAPFSSNAFCDAD